MSRSPVVSYAMIPLILLAGCNASPSAGTGAATPVTIPNLQPYLDTTGTLATYTTAGLIDESNPFFAITSANGRTCATCHQPSQGMTITPTAAATLFTSTGGADPLFAAIDGANCPTVATGDTAGHSLLLNNGLIRIAVTLPANAQFTVTVLHDPYGCAASLSSGQQTVSIYRRPLPVSGLPYLSSVMWDMRETVAALDNAGSFSANLTNDLTAQILNAVATHFQNGASPTIAQINAGLAFEQSVFTAQMTDAAAGSLSAGGANGGPTNMAAANYYPGINDAFGGDPAGARFNPSVFNLYAAWSGSSNAAQASIARGEVVFNTAPMNITGVRGLNDNAALGNPAVLHGSCGTCHDAPNLGHHSLPLPMDTGVSRLTASETSAQILAGVAQLTAPDMPVYQITGCTDTTGAPVTYVTTDPGRGLFTGLCADVNRVKIPSLRGLGGHAPYFHNGSATTLIQLVNFYNARFQMGLNPTQKQDLVNFLAAL
jgi:cytochrome c peroxidase